jgi:exosortase F-associated protein
MNKRLIRFSLLLMLGIITFVLGFIRYDYIINLIDFSLPVLLPRQAAEQTSYPLDFHHLMSSIVHDPRWLSSMLYMIYPAIATSIAVYLIFQRKNYVQLTLLFYATGIVMLLVLVMYSLILHDYANGYAIAQYLKKIYQEPYASLLLLGSFYWDQQKKK